MDCKTNQNALRMKKILLFLVLVITSITAFAEDRNAYISNVEHYSEKTVVTVSAKPSALKQYQNGFMVGVRPANHVFDLFLLTSRSEKSVRLTPENPSVDIVFWCDEAVTGKKACNRDDFVVRSKP